MITGFKEVLDAIKNEKELKQIKFSLLDSSLNDILFVVPTYSESKKINSLIQFNPAAINFLMIEVLNQYVPRTLDRSWLFGDAPAGLLLSTFKGILSSSYPKDANTVARKLDLYRKNGNLFDSIVEILTCELNIDISTINKMTIDQIINLLAIGEKNLIQKERLESELEISGPSFVEPDMFSNSIIDHYRKHGIKEGLGGLLLTDVTSMDRFEQIKEVRERDLQKKRQYIDFEKENKELMRALGPGENEDIIRDDLDPYKTHFIKGQEHEVKLR